ncbi:MAG: OmpH family outer membrane protein [Candidatus Omnitrophica bacterium]|nr:OmpH family outer membrane protein [Candidatus Omnitrophota bacterium]
MDKIKKMFLTGIFSSLIFAGTAFSQTVKIGCVDLKTVFDRYEKAKSVEADFLKKVETKQKEVGVMEEKIKKMQAEYEQKKDVMKPEEKSKKESELKEEIKKFADKWTEVNKELDKERKELEEELLEEIRKEVKAYGEKNGFAVILDSRVVIYGQKSVDLTEQMIKIVNK